MPAWVRSGHGILLTSLPLRLLGCSAVGRARTQRGLGEAEAPADLDMCSHFPLLT